MNIAEITSRARSAARITKNLTLEKRNGVLQKFAENLRNSKEQIIAANQIDLSNCL